MSIIQAFLWGILGGGLATGGVALWIGTRQPDVDPNAGLAQQIADVRTALESQTKIKTNLTAPDLLTVACGADYMATNGPLLCREMFCRLQHNGGGAAQSECEQIANVANTITVYDACNKTTIDYDKCIDFVTRRK
jgi:hypothetical protein